MVYNRDSIWRHLYVAYQRMVVDGDYSGLSIDEAFSRTTDGEDCPIARNYSGGDFVAECEAAGFEARYLGGYFLASNWTCFESVARRPWQIPSWAPSIRTSSARSVPTTTATLCTAGCTLASAAPTGCAVPHPDRPGGD